MIKMTIPIHSEEKEKPEVVQPVCHGSNSNIVPFTTEEAKDNHTEK